ncbi:MAG: DUF5658 family protein [Planctomycetota bacterium]|nr:DUF5658 family protein [Planctomycetota bacterium]
MTATTATRSVPLTQAPYSELMWQTAVIMLLCLLDAILTLNVLQLGAEEWNPVMAKLLEFGPAAFIGVKMVWTLAGCGILMLLGRHRVARLGLSALLIAYICLTTWHLVGQTQIALAVLG